MQLSHTRRLVSATFDEPNLVSAAGLVPLMALAGKAGLCELADERVSVPTDQGANAGLKLSSLVAGMGAGAGAGADSIEDMALLRHGGMGKAFTGAYAPSTLGSFLRSFTVGHVRQKACREPPTPCPATAFGRSDRAEVRRSKVVGPMRDWT